MLHRNYTIGISWEKRKDMKDKIRFIDLFAGMGGIRQGFEQACDKYGIQHECVMTSEIKPAAISVLHQNHEDENLVGDITQINENAIPDFDVCLAGIPCQAFSSAGKRLGFEDTRGTLFFDVARILKAKQPSGIIIENVEGLVNHDKQNKTDKIGRTLSTMLSVLDELGYHVSWRVLNAADFGLAQNRKRIYIIGSRYAEPDMQDFRISHAVLADVLEHIQYKYHSDFVDNLLEHYSVQELIGKSIKDKRGGKNNIHSWDLELKGKVSEKQKTLLNMIIAERRKTCWSWAYEITPMDGVPLTLEMVMLFSPYNKTETQSMLDDLVKKQYLVLEHPKKLVNNKRVPDLDCPEGYNIVSGKMSFEVSHILNPEEQAPTLVAMDMNRLFVPDGNSIRHLTVKEGLRLFGYPDDFSCDVPLRDAYDLLGNTVCVPVIEQVNERLLDTFTQSE